jgi:hypothetical protein
MRHKHRKRKNLPLRPSDQDIHEAIEEAIQTLVNRGLVVDSGEREWSERTRRYEIVWMAAPTRH